MKSMIPARENFVQDETPKFNVILIYSDTCGHCIKFKPTFDEVSASSEFDANVTFKKVAVDNAGDYAQYVNSGIPAVLVERNGVVDGSKTLVGNMDSQTFKDRLAPLLV
jgi:thiol-disulfide isomerase/thioredoxin